jgi:competence protein ComEC
LVFAADQAPGSYFYTAGLPDWWLAALYGAAGALALAPQWRPPWPALASLGLVWLAVGIGPLAARGVPQDELRCTFLGMGHGTCAVLELPGGETLLYDAGSLGSPDAAAKIVSSYLWSRGIERIDAVVLSHADIDHYNAMPGLVERFDVGSVYISPMMFDPVATDGRLEAPNYLRDVLQAAGVPLRTVWMGDRLRTGDERVAIEVLHPPREGVFGRDNANSLLLVVEFAGRRLLLPGDLESPGLEGVIAEAPLDCDVLLAPHHGSARSDPPGFAAWCTPEWVVLSGERPERTVSAQDSYEQAGASVFHTARDGAVTFELSASAVRVASFRSPAE